MMGKFKQIIRWPANDVNIWAPWYQVAWRGLWIVPVVGVLSLYCLLVGLMYGPTKGLATWSDNI